MTMSKSASLLVLTGVLASYAAAQSPETGSVASGKTLYNEKFMCYTCHGYSGQNGSGARLVPMKMAQTAFIAYVRNPSQPNRMPSFSPKVMSDAQLADVYAYIQSLPNSAPDPATLPLLKDLMK
jgi:mono/diheme cytochrome c family protein